LEKSDTIHEDLTKLILLAQMSAAKGDGSHQLNTFKTISRTVDNIGSLQTLNSSQILACVDLLKIIVTLQQGIVKSEDVSSKEIPSLYNITHTLNNLFVKSSKDAISSGDTVRITQQCEALLQAINHIRSDASLRTCGILDAKLKDVAGKLREKADIMNLFQGKDSKLFAKVISSAEKELEETDLVKIGETYATLQHLNAKFKQKYPLKSNLTHYLVKFRDTYLEKIKERINELKKESAKGLLPVKGKAA
jgi:molybdopterin converting factor small subunit